MKSKELSLREALSNVSEGYANAKPDQDEFARFKTSLTKLFGKIDAGAGEENQKNVVAEFLKDAYYKDKHDINTKDKFKIDLVIHTGKSSQTPVAVIIETKNPGNAAEMITADNLNAKALHQLVLYYFREKNSGNDEITHLIATNVSEWFIFDAAVFKSLFYENTELFAYFQKHAAKKLDDNSTSAFYEHVERLIDASKPKIAFTHFKLEDYKNADEDSLIELYKILSPEHLLKLTFKNDSNTLNKKFYNELLYIIGLTEVSQNGKASGKKLIERCKNGERQNGSLLENAIDRIVADERLENVEQYGSNPEERLFNAALELAITWVNRILFLKLMESQLLSYHQRDEAYLFLTFDKIKNYDTLNDLFFRVLACKSNERQAGVKEAFEKVPYLNSSLFTPTELEKKTLRISALRDDKTISVFPDTVIKDGSKKKSGKMPLLKYLFAFLNAYDFGSERDNKFQSQDKLINASVLGLIFEKINGYKDGSHFTPGFITMYMCREAIRKAVVQKFNEEMRWDCKEFSELYNEIMRNRCQQKANEIINSLKICDPAVGSGHFLVSALNEVIALKSELEILQDSRGTLLNVRVTVEDDELVVKYRNDDQFAYYYPNNCDCQRVQETLFHEKQTIIENCIFGVDINPNAVAICRLRLWIELLKNAYYKNPAELETLPNIDINIKCGNSLVNRFPLDTDLKNVLKGKRTVEKYRKSVDTYRNAKSSDEKQAMERLIAEIKSSFRSELSSQSKEAVALRKLKGKLHDLTKQKRMFEKSKKEHAAWKNEVLKVTAEIENQEAANEAITSNKIYANAFEWRFEFPEVLNDRGEFVGFDVVIGNPPYIDSEQMVRSDPDMRAEIAATFKTAKGNWDLYIPFWEASLNLTHKTGCVHLITPNKWLAIGYGESLRAMMLPFISKVADYSRYRAFENVGVFTVAVLALKQPSEVITVVGARDAEIISYQQDVPKAILQDFGSWGLVLSKNLPFIVRLVTSNDKLKSVCDFQSAFTVSEAYEIIEHLTEWRPASREYLKFANTGTIDPYVCLWGIKSTTYIKSKYTKPIITKRDLRTHFPNRFERAIQPKFIISGMRHFEAFYDDDGSWLPGKSTVVALPIAGKVSWKFLLGLLNSSVSKAFFRECYGALAMDGGIAFTNKNCGEIPIPNKFGKVQQQVEQLVDKILTVKKVDATADTTALASEIDRLVYELYGLTKPEIAIVEGRNG